MINSRLVRGTLLATFILGSTALFGQAQTPPDQSYRYLYVSGPKLKKAPTVDGTVNVDEWAGAGMAPRLYHQNEDRVMDLESKYYFGYTDEALYVAFQIQRPANGIAPRADFVERDRAFFRQDDVIEFWLNCLPVPHTERNPRDFYLAWNARGTQFDRRDKDGNRNFNPNWQIVCRTVPGFGWEGEARLPFKEFAPMQEPKAGDEWRYMLMDNQTTPFPALGISAWAGADPVPDNFTRLRITGDNGAFVRVLESGLLRATGKGGGVFEVVNPGSQPQKIAAKLKLYRKKDDAQNKLTYLRGFEQSRDKSGNSDSGKVLLLVSDDDLSKTIISDNYELLKEQSEDLSLAAGERKTMDFAHADRVGDYLLIYDYRSADGKVIAGGPLPFIIPAALEVKFANFFLQDKSVTAAIDLRYITGWKDDCTLDATVGKLTEHWTAEKLGQKYDYKFSVKDWPIGDYKLHLVAKDASGKVLAERDAPLDVPAMPKWFTEKAGMTPAVPEPWTPINAHDNKLSFLMGDYEVSGAGFVNASNVRSIYDENKVPVLRAPITLQGKVGGQDIAWTDGKLVTTDKKDDAVSMTGSATAGSLAMTTEMRFEYDGMQKIVVTLAPAAGQKVEINELSLQVPIQKEFSALYLCGQAIDPSKMFPSAGKIPNEGIKFPFITSVWVGNEERGFRWFSENMKGWYVGKKFAGETVELLNSAEGATIKLNLIKDEKPFVLDKPRTMTFGFMFTPPKTVRHDLVKLATTAAKETEGKAGVRALETWYFKNQGWPEVYDDKERAEKLAFAQKAHQFGMKVTPYSGWYLHRQSLVYPVFGSEMVVEPLIDGGCDCDVCCWNTAVQDAYVGAFADRIKDIDLDGFRLDAGFAVELCSSLVHHGYDSECGWIDDKGVLQPSRAIFAARKTAQRAYRLFHGGGKDNGFCIQHVHGANRYDPILANVDSVLSVEGKEMMMKSLTEAPLDFYRANVMGDAHGYQVVYLPKSRTLGSDSFYGLALLHNFSPRGVPNGQPNAFAEVSYSRAATSPREVWRAREWIGPYEKGTEFWGYWKNSAFLKTSSPHIISGFQVRRGEKLLLAALNLERKPAEGTVTVDLKALGFAGKVYAFDPILREPVDLNDGTIKLTFTPEGYRCIEIASNPFDVFVPEKISKNLIPEAAPATWPTAAAPAGWTASKFVDERNPMQLSNGDLAVKDGALVLTGDGATTMRISKALPNQPGKFYMLEVEATIACSDGAFLGEWPDVSQFYISSGDRNWGHKRSFTGQPLPGTTQKFQLYSPGGRVIDIVLRQAKGQAVIKNLALYEVKALPPGFQVFGGM